MGRLFEHGDSAPPPGAPAPGGRQVAAIVLVALPCALLAMAWISGALDPPVATPDAVPPAVAGEGSSVAVATSAGPRAMPPGPPPPPTPRIPAPARPPAPPRVVAPPPRKERPVATATGTANGLAIERKILDAANGAQRKDLALEAIASAAKLELTAEQVAAIGATAVERLTPREEVERDSLLTALAPYADTPRGEAVFLSALRAETSTEVDRVLSSLYAKKARVGADLHARIAEIAASHGAPLVRNRAKGLLDRLDARPR